MPATAFLRAAARVVEFDGDDGEGLDDQVWARLEALPDPRSPQGLREDDFFHNRQLVTLGDNRHLDGLAG